MSTRRSWRWAAVVSAGVCIAACGSSDPPSGAGPGNSSDEPGTQIDLSCDQASFGSAQWTACETRNFAHVSEGPLESVNPMFAVAWQAQGLRNVAQWTARSVSDPSWLSPRSGNTVALPLCTTWALPCLGDPFRYPQSPGPNGEVFYDTEAEVTPVVFYDEGCARISGRIWTPRGDAATFPGIVIENGSVQAPEPLYWWAAQALVRAGYMVMTFDPRGQGRSDQQTPSGELGSNFNQSVFWTGLVNAIDFFRSSSAQPYPHNITCADSYPTVVDAFNPDIARLDADRLGIAGHSLGGIGVSVVQSYGAEGADPWPGLIDADNPSARVFDDAIAAAFRGRVRFMRNMRVGLDVVYRDVSFLVLNVPGLTPYVSFASETEQASQVFGAIWWDWFIDKLKIRPGVTVALMQPASFKARADASGSRQVQVIREANDYEILPAGTDPFSLIAVKASLRWHLSPILALVGEVAYVQDFNNTRVVTDPNTGVGVRELDQARARQLGLNFFMQAAF